MEATRRTDIQRQDSWIHKNWRNKRSDKTGLHQTLCVYIIAFMGFLSMWISGSLILVPCFGVHFLLLCCLVQLWNGGFYLIFILFWMEGNPNGSEGGWGRPGRRRGRENRNQKILYEKKVVCMTSRRFRFNNIMDPLNLSIILPLFCWIPWIPCGRNCVVIHTHTQACTHTFRCTWVVLVVNLIPSRISWNSSC